jgi:hypothetical protein
MPSNLLLVRLILAAFFLGEIQSALCQKAPTLQLSSVGTNGQLTLLAYGEAGTNYALEASVDLKSWWKADSGNAANGQVGFTYAAAPDMVPRFFRARVDVPLPPLNVRVQPDTNAFTLGVVAPGVGAVLSFYDQNLVHYSLTIPTNAVDEPLVVGMTLVTNLEGRPFSAGLLGAVSISPANQFLLAAATLEIDFPTNKVSDPSLVTGFAFDTDGSYLRLAPGFADTNSIILQFYTLAGFGCSVATSVEVAQLGQRPSAPVISVTNLSAMLTLGSQTHRPKGAYFPTRLDECYPAKLARAKLIDNYLDARIAVLGAELAAQAISTKRSNRNLGPYPQDWGPSSGFHWPGNQDYVYSDFYYQNIDPYLAEAAGNCALTEVLDYRIRELVDIANSWGGSATATIGSRLTLCSGYHDCIKETIDCCNTQGLGGQDTVLDAQVFAGKAAAIGCTIGSTELDMVSKACLPTWSGSIITLNVVSNYSSLSDGTLTSESKEVESGGMILHTDSVGLSGNSAGAGVYFLTGNLQGSGFINYTFDFHSVDTGCCSGCTTDEHLQGGTTAKATAMGNFTFRLTNSPPPPVPIPLWNTVIPNSDIILAANQCPYAGSEVLKSSGFITIPGNPEPVCSAFAPLVEQFSGTSGFANLLPYEVVDTGVQGTVIKYSGRYETNSVSTNGATITTKYSGASWVFKHN